MLSHVLRRDLVHVNCFRIPSLTRSPVRVAYPSAFLFHCRRLMRGSGDVNICSNNMFNRFVAFRAFGLSRKPAMLDRHFHPQLISRKHTLHLCKVKPTMCRPEGETKFGQIQVWPKLCAKFGQTKFGQDQVWPDQVWPKPSLATLTTFHITKNVEFLWKIGEKRKT